MINIKPIQFNNTPQHTKYNNNVCFGNGFNVPLSPKAISMLKQNIFNVIPCTELNEVNKIMPYMVKRQKTLYPQSKSIALFKLTDNDLKNFVEKSGEKIYNLPYFEGIGIAIGDCGTSIEKWNNVYETIVCLVPKVNAESFKYRVFAENIAAM